MTLIDEQLIEATCEEVAALDEEALSSAMKALGTGQPDLLAFVMATCEELRAEAAELGMYVFFVVCRSFERAAGAKLERALQERVLAAEESMDAVLATMGEADAGFLARLEKAEFSPQPVLAQYIVDVLEQYGEGEGEAALSGEERWLLFYVLHTVVEVLDDLE